MRRDPPALAPPCALARALAGAPAPAAAAGFDPPAALSAPTLDPRAPVSHYQVLSGRHSSRLGLRVAAPPFKRWAVHESTTLDAFFALDNWSRAVPISYQTVRAHVGLDTSWASPWLDARLPAGQRAAAQLGYFHESDHVTDVNDFAAAYAPGGTTAGLANAAGVNARFSCPRGLALDAAGANLYVCDYVNNALRVIATLTSLDLVSNRIGEAGATQLAECLRVNATLTSLQLASNRIGAAGATQLAECLRVNATLTSLNLGGNGIGATGATQLAECLRVNATLKSLDLSFNGIGDAGATQLAECLRVNATLKSLSLINNGIGGAGARALEAACPPQCMLEF
jgi:hypothetical protein